MKTYGDYLAEIFPGVKVQKISVDAGFSCPNRDGKIGSGGCIYCRNDSFSPGYCNSSESIVTQINKGKNFFSRKYPDMKYLVYFQSYTGTYNKSPEELLNLYTEALNVEGVVGLVIGTRPDCIPDPVIEILKKINDRCPVFIELGVESSHNHTLHLINRNHTWEDTVDAVTRVHQAGIHCGVHLIAGLPGESEEMVLETVRKVAQLPVETIKFHQLQILYDTPLYNKFVKGEISVPEISLEDYLNLCVRILEILPQTIIIERFLAQSPPHLVMKPSWGLKNYEFMAKLAKLLDKRRETL